MFRDAVTSNNIMLKIMSSNLWCTFDRPIVFKTVKCFDQSDMVSQRVFCVAVNIATSVLYVWTDESRHI